MRLLILGLLALAGASACRSGRAREWLGPQRVAQLESATEVVVWTMPADAEPGRRRDAVPPAFAQRARVGPLAASEARALAACVLNSSSWEFDLAKGCLFFPGVALEVRGDEGAEPLWILLCFGCDQWGFSDGQSLRIEDCDPARPELLRIVRTVLPDFLR